MDATPPSGDNGFDAALRALEDLETSVAQSREEREEKVAAVAPEAAAPMVSGGMIGFAEVDEADPAPAAEAPAQAEAPAAIEALSTVEPVAEPAPADEAVPLATAPEPVAAATPAAPAEAAAPAKAKRKLSLKFSGPLPWAKIAVGMGLFSSVVSAAGLIIAVRAVVSAELVVATARERQEQFEHASKLIADLKIVRDKQVELLRAQQAQLQHGPVSSAELQVRMENLQRGLLERDPLNKVVEAVREGQAATNAQLREFAMKMDRLEATVGH